MSANELNQVWQPEQLLTGWLAASFMLMTTSLLFYHMTRVNSLLVDPKIAGILSVILILAALFLGAFSLYAYFQRIGNVVKNNKNLKKEKLYRNAYTVLVTSVMIVELGVAILIILGSFS